MEPTKASASEPISILFRLMITVDLYILWLILLATAFWPPKAYHNIITILLTGCFILIIKKIVVDLREAMKKK